MSQVYKKDEAEKKAKQKEPANTKQNMKWMKCMK